MLKLSPEMAVDARPNVGLLGGDGARGRWAYLLAIEQEQQRCYGHWRRKRWIRKKTFLFSKKPLDCFSHWFTKVNKIKDSKMFCFFFVTKVVKCTFFAAAAAAVLWRWVSPIRGSPQKKRKMLFSYFDKSLQQFFSFHQQNVLSSSSSSSTHVVDLW